MRGDFASRSTAPKPWTPRAAIREKQIVLPRREPILETFARHMAADAKILDEDPETGAKKYRYVRTGEDHYSLAFTYAWMAARDRFMRGPLFEWVGGSGDW